MPKHQALMTLCCSAPDMSKMSPKEIRRMNPSLGHVWILIEEDGKPPETYGLWPDPKKISPNNSSTRFLSKNGWDGSGTHVQKDIEINDPRGNVIKQCRSWKLSEEKLHQLRTLISKSDAYVYTENNCVDWAFRIAGKVLGPKVNVKRELIMHEGHNGKTTYSLSTPRGFLSNICPLHFRNVMAEMGLRKSDQECQPVIPVQSQPAWSGLRVRVLSWVMPVLFGVIMKGSKYGSAAPC